MQRLRSKIINTLFLSSFFVVVVASFARYYYLKEFPVQIEVSCDPTIELCFQRDCESEECPPNGFNTYRRFELSGYVFASCDPVDGCESTCKSDSSQCLEFVCGENEDDVCSEIIESEPDPAIDEEI